MPSHHATRTLFTRSNYLLCVLSVSAANLVHAGPLTPPVGPIAPTPGPEPRIAVNAANTPGDADSLFKITQSGSYFLPGDIIGVAGKHGIEIASWGVTLDLNGFELDGFVAGTLDGISITAGGPRNITVMNGSVREWDGKGVNVDLSVACRVEGIIASNNGSDGIIAGMFGVVERCSAYNNGGKGIIADSGSSVSHCASVGSGSNGISLGSGCAISDCTSYGSGANGLTTGSYCVVARCTISGSATDGIRASNDTSVIGCTSGDNGLDGIECATGCLIRDNNCPDNGTSVTGGAGIHATGSDNRIESNHCTNADRGIDVDAAANVIIKNTCAGNTINYSLVADNYYGPIILRTGIATPAVNGSTAAGTLATTDPHANFAH